MAGRLWPFTEEGRRESERRAREYWQEVNKSDGFDVSGLRPPDYYPRLMEFMCNDTCSPLVQLYARMGLHRYSILQGKNLQLSRVKKYNQSMGSAASCYYITLEAMDPATDLLQTFQTSVSELMFGELVLSCSIARPLGETKRSDIGEISRSCDYKPVKNFFLENTIPEWPPENPFKNSKRSYVLNKSELKKNKDWIRLYLELAIATDVRDSLKDDDLSSVKIVKVAIDTSTQDVEEGLKDAKFFAIVYIRYKDSCEARVGKDIDRVAIVRRAFNQPLGCFSLVGQTMSSDIIPKEKGKMKQLLFTMPSKPFKLSRFKHSRLGLSRRLHKTRSITMKRRHSAMIS